MATKKAWFWKVRRYPERHFVSVWLCCQTGAAVAALLFGELTEAALAALLAAVPLAHVATEDALLAGLVPMHLGAVGVATVPRQQELFPDVAAPE